MDRLDLLLLGATGFSGKRCIPYLHRFSKKRNLTWGVAGRSETKLADVLKNAGEVGADLQKIPIIIVDITDSESLENMVRRAKVVINCCGPFRFLGELVVKACIAAGTHHVDISAEPQFMEKLELDLKEAAREKGVYVVTACGFDCIPSDMGAVFIQKQFKGTLNSLTLYLDVWLEEGGKSKPLIGYSSNSVLNFGTWESLIPCVVNWKEIGQNHKMLFPEAMSKFQPEVKQKYMPHRSEVIGGWCFPLPTADASSMKRSQKYLYESEQKRPIQVNTYFATKSFFQVFLLSLFVILVYPFTRFKFGCNLLLRYPGLFTLGMFRKTSPIEEVVRNTCYQVTFYGEGWEDQVGPKDFNYHKPCDRCILGRISGRDGYEVTAIGAVLSAIVVITEKDKLLARGGVFSAGACFAETSLIEQLIEHGLKFEILHEKRLANCDENN